MEQEYLYKICYLTTIDTNVGDDWIREGIHYLLEKAFSSSVGHVCVNIHDWKGTIIDAQGQDKILSSDGIIMAGTPFYFLNERKDLLRKILKVYFSGLGLLTGYSKYDGRCSGAPHVKPLWYDRVQSVWQHKPVAILAAGTNLAYNSDGSELLNDRYIKRFMNDIHSWSRLNTVREPLADQILNQLGIEHELFPCTAFWAMDGLDVSPQIDPEYIVLNYMAGGGHYRFEKKPEILWESVAVDLFRRCTQRYGAERVKVICHDAAEADAATRLLGSKSIWYDPGYKKTLESYSYARTGVVNRCHAQIVMAGLGSPSVVVGKDSRTLMAQEVKLPRYYYENVDVDTLFNHVCAMYDGFEGYRTTLRDLKAIKERRYVDVIKERYVRSFA